MDAESAAWVVLVAAIIVLAAVGGVRVAARFGLPGLLFYMLLGLFLGEDGPGGIPFDNADLATALGYVALVIILAVQTVVLAAYVAFVTFRVMGKNYDAAVLCAGQCGFGMGATPTAVANMQAITNQYGASHKAFLIVPMVGAFFIDLVNAVVLQLFIKVVG